MQTREPIGVRRIRLGREGEDKVANWYRRRGYVILERNWRAGNRGEIDIIAAKRGLVVFCEVKTRSTNRFGNGFDSIDARKQAQIRRIAASWLDSEEHPPVRVRFDAAAVVAGNIEVIHAAF